MKDAEMYTHPVSTSALKFLVLLLIFFGEFLLIFAEIRGANTYSIPGQSFGRVFLQMFVVFIIGGIFLLSGYILGYRAFQNIWLLTAISVASVLIIEPTMSFVIFQQIPTRGAWMGLGFGTAGLLSALFL